MPTNLPQINFKRASVLGSEQIFKLLNSSWKGLTEKEAKERLTILGENLIPEEKISAFKIFFRQFKSPLSLLLLVAFSISFFLKDFESAFFILLFLLINSFLVFFQEYKNEKSLSFLKTILKTKTKVLREGKQMIILSSKLVPGDIILLKAGDLIPADCLFLKTEKLSVDESLLTGESKSVSKNSETLKKEVSNFYEATNIGFSQTLVVSGKAKAIIFATGKNTFIGEIAQETQKIETKSAFEIEIGKLVSFLIKIIIVVLIFSFSLNFFLKRGTISFGSLLVFAIALAISVVPEPLPLVTTFAITRGALLLIKKGVIVKRLSAIEDLGSIDVLCTDKTGTITQNILKVAEVWGNKEEVLLWGLLASNSFFTFTGEIDSFLEAIKKEFSLEKINKIKKEYSFLGGLPFDPLKRYEVVCCQNKEGIKFFVYKGAPEIFIKKGALQKEKINQWIKQQGQMGRRVIGVGIKKLGPEKEKIKTLGFISFYDPLKRGAKETLQEAQSLGLSIKILSGDAKEVVGAMAYQIGLINNPEEVLSGEEFSKLSPEEKILAVEKYHAFSRVLPLEKCEIIKFLQKRGHLVGFLGEGFNDVPALKTANLSLVVEKAADISKENSDIVLTQKGLKIINEGIKEGRKIFANTTKYIKATLIANFGNFFALIGSSFMINYLPLLPSQILLLDLLSDFPMVSISQDAVEKKELISSKKYQLKEIFVLATLLGTISTLFDFTFFGLFAPFGEKTLQTMWFIGSVLTEVVLIFSIRSSKFFLKAEKPPFLLIGLSLVVVLLTILLPFSRWGQTIFEFQTPIMAHLLLVFGVTATYLIVSELGKLLLLKYLEKRENIN